VVERVLIGIGVGVAGEIGALLGRLWVYRNLLYPVLNVLLMFGLVMGTLAWAGGALHGGAVRARVRHRPLTKYGISPGSDYGTSRRSLARPPGDRLRARGVDRVSTVPTSRGLPGLP
jgi:hypothetical protein